MIIDFLKEAWWLENLFYFIMIIAGTKYILRGR